MLRMILMPKRRHHRGALQKLCHNNPTGQVRYLADKSACQCANRYGDALFRREVDGVELPGPSHCFYGISASDGYVRGDRALVFNVSDIYRLEQVRTLAHAFMYHVSLLPFVSVKDMSRERRKFDKIHAKAHALARACSPYYVVYVWLIDKLTCDVADIIFSFNDVERCRASV